jgi:hypothetical protein
MNTTMKTLSALTIAAAAFAATVGSSSALTFRQPPGGFHCFTCGTQAKPLPFRIPPGGFHCFVCGTPKAPPTGSNPPGHGWNHGYGWNRGYGWRNRPEIIVEGQPQAIGVSAPVQSAPAYAPTAAPQAAAEPCNCLTKQSLPDGSVLFQDICTKESAIASPTTVGAR